MSISLVPFVVCRVQSFGPGTKHKIQNTDWKAQIAEEPMCTDRRDFLRLSAGVVGATLLGSASVSAQQGNQPEAVRRLRRMTDNVVPITLEERKGRIEKAQKLMRDNRIDAIFL